MSVKRNGGKASKKRKKKKLSEIRNRDKLSENGVWYTLLMVAILVYLIFKWYVK